MHKMKGRKKTMLEIEQWHAIERKKKKTTEIFQVIKLRKQ